MLPAVHDWDAYGAVRGDEAALRPGVEALCRQLGVDTGALGRFAAGSRPVYAAGDLVLKLYPQVDTGACAIETAVLSAVEAALAAATPRVHSSGRWDGWGYLLMSRLPGVPLDVAWPELAAADRDRLATQVGELLAGLHRVPPPSIPCWYPDQPWPEFVARQRAAAAARQLGKGLAGQWADQIDGFLDRVTLPGEPPVLLHTEIMREHLLVQPDPWRLTGLIDFEPAMAGAREYEFAAVGVFVSEGDAGWLRRMLLAYGYGPADLDGALSRRLLAWLLVHRYSDLPWYFERMPAPAAPTLDALAARWFGC